MVRHVFLTGKKHVGKSALLKKILARYSGCVGGFQTVKTSDYLRDCYSVHFCAWGEAFFPSAHNLLFVCGQFDEQTGERFNRLVGDLLNRSAGASLLVMDELGPHESYAAAFHAAILQLLDGAIPTLGVLQAPAELYWPEIVRHPKVTMIDVNESNREEKKVIEEILSILTGEE